MRLFTFPSQQAALIVTGFLLSSPSWAHKGHEHGLMSVDVSIDQKNLVAEIRIPAIDLVGFETAPRSPKQEAKVAEALANLQSIFPATLNFQQDQGPCTGTLEKVERVQIRPKHAEFALQLNYKCPQPIDRLNADWDQAKLPKIKTVRIIGLGTAKRAIHLELTKKQPKGVL